MDFRQLEAFCAVVEWGNFSEAAKQLYLTQPTISNHIRALEKELNTRLIDRTTKTMSLTADGQTFYEYAKNLLRLKEKALQEFRHTDLHHILLGASSIPSAYLLPELLSAYRQKDPQVRFDVMQADSAAILERIRGGVLNLGITGTPITEEPFCCIPIFQDEMVLATPTTAHYQKLKESRVPLEILLQEPFLMREDGSGTKKETEQFLETLGMNSSVLNIAARMNDLECIKQSIIYGLGISILSKKVTKDLERAGRIFTFPLKSGGVYRHYYLVYRKSVSYSQPIGDFLSFVQEYYSPAAIRNTENPDG